ncbi:MAG: hypothetical protein CL819_09005 [Croceicoccus sp.]|nr:hypothetical protein [Croceicoccus sp.]
MTDEPIVIDLVECPACVGVDPSASLFACKLCQDEKLVQRSLAAHWLLVAPEPGAFTQEDLRVAVQTLRSQSKPAPHRVFVHPAQLDAIKGKTIDQIFVDEITGPKPKRRRKRKGKRRK